MHAPQITFSSSAAGIGGGQMVGVGNQHAILWPDENPAHAISLNPVGTGLEVFRAEAFGVSGGRQVGVATLSPDGGNSLLRAWLWNSSASSWVNLHPGMDGSTHSTALGIEGNQQVGQARFFTGGLEYHRAVLWSGTAASRVYLSPPSLHFNTKAVATDGVQQVGAYYDSSGVLGAALWAGSAASYVNLNPAGAVESQATDVENGKQVGYSRFGTSQHAGYWTGSASSWVDLHPDGALSSRALGIAGNIIVGHVDGHAAIWNLATGSMFDLNSVLPPGTSGSIATGVSIVGETVYVSGAAGQMAYRWSGPVPAPATTGVLACAAVDALRRRR